MHDIHVVVYVGLDDSGLEMMNFVYRLLKRLMLLLVAKSQMEDVRRKRKRKRRKPCQC